MLTSVQAANWWTLCDQCSLSVIRSVILLCFGGNTIQVQIVDHFSTSIHHCSAGDLGDLLAFLIQSPVDFHDTQRNE